MKKLLLTLVFLAFAGSALAYGDWSTDAHGHWTKTKNLWKDTDRDGVPNYYDRRDDNKRIGY